MKKTSILLIAMCCAVVSFAQYASKADAIQGRVSKPSVAIVNTPKQTTVNYFSETFETGTVASAGWATIDADGDAKNWTFSTSGITAHGGVGGATSASWVSPNPVTPNNYLITPHINLTTASGTVLLKYYVSAQDQAWPSEHYKLCVSTTGIIQANFSTILYEETILAGGPAGNNYWERTVNLSAYAGQQIYLAWVHYNCTDMYRINLDDVSIDQNSTADGAITAAVAPNNLTDCQLTATEPVTITILNNGGTAISNFPVSYTINGGAPVTENVTASIAPAATYNYTFTQTANLGTLGYYNMGYSIAVPADVNAANNTFTNEVRNTDGVLTVSVQSDGNSGQSWELKNSAGTVVASRGPYQWNITTTENYCILDNDCYTFNWLGGTSNILTLTYNGSPVYTGTLTGNYTVYSIGGACVAIDASLLSVTPVYALVGNVSFGGTVQNIGSSNITAYTVTYSVNGGATSAVYSKTGINLTSGQTSTFTHNVPYNFLTNGTNSLTVTVTTVNGGADGNTINNAITQNIYIVTTVPQKVVFGEEGTGTWCGYCVRGHVYMEYMDVTYPNTWIGVAVHNGDPMVVTAYDDAIGALISGYPSGLVDRVNGEFDPLDFENAYQTQINEIPPVALSINNLTYNSISKLLTFDVVANCAADLNGAYRFNAVLSENDVHSLAAGYEQTNYYAGNALGPMGGYEVLADPVPAADMYYDNVARALLGGFDGTSGSVPTTVTSGTTLTKTYSYTLNTSWVPAKINVIGLFINNTTGAIVNAARYPALITGVNNESLESKIIVYPNPSNGNIYIRNAENTKVSIINVLGEVISSFDNTSSFISVSLSNQPQGIYFVKITDGNKVMTNKVILTK